MLDYSQSKGVPIMSDIARATSCTYQPFSQMTLIKHVGGHLNSELGMGRTGICHGIAVAWLETVSKNEANFLDRLADFSNSPMFYRAYMAFRHQAKYAGFNTSWSSSKAFSREVRDQFFGYSAVTQNSGLSDTGKSRTYGLSQMDSMCTWLCTGGGTRYYLVHVPNHVMAAIASRFGTLHFFDPNCGIVSSRMRRQVATCLSRWFNHDDIKKLYEADDNDWMTVHKFK